MRFKDVILIGYGYSLGLPKLHPGEDCRTVRSRRARMISALDGRVSRPEHLARPSSVRAECQQAADAHPVQSDAARLRHDCNVGNGYEPKVAPGPIVVAIPGNASVARGGKLPVKQVLRSRCSDVLEVVTRKPVSAIEELGSGGTAHRQGKGVATFQHGIGDHRGERRSGSGQIKR